MYHCKQKDDIFPVYSTSREYIGEYAGNMSLLVPYSSDSQVSQTNYCSTFKYLANIPIVVHMQEPHIIEYTDNLSVCQDTRYREYTGNLQFTANISGSIG